MNLSTQFFTQENAFKVSFPRSQYLKNNKRNWNGNKWAKKNCWLSIDHC